MAKSLKEFVPGDPIITRKSGTSVISLASPEPIPRRSPNELPPYIGQGMSITELMDLEDALQNPHQVLKKFMPGDLFECPPVINPSRSMSMMNYPRPAGFKPGEITIFAPGLGSTGILPVHIEMSPDEFNRCLALLGIDVADEQAKVEAMAKIIPTVTEAQAERYISDIKRALQEKPAMIVIDSFVEKGTDDDG